MKEAFILLLNGCKCGIKFPGRGGFPPLVLAKNIVLRSAIQSVLHCVSDFIVIGYERMVANVTNLIVCYKRAE